MRNTLANNKGSTLLLVIIVFAMLLIFGMAAIGLSASVHKNSVTDYQTQQAYFTARSAVLAAVDYIKADADPKALLEQLDGKTSSKTTDAQLGDYEVAVKKLDDTHYQISSLADVRGVQREYYTVLELKASNPFKNLASITGENSVSTFDNMNKSHGDIYIQKRKDGRPAEIKFLTVYGDLVIDGDVNFVGGQLYVYGSIYVNGNAKFDSIDVKKIDGDLRVWGNLTCGQLNGDTDRLGTVTGDTYVAGTIQTANDKHIGGKREKPLEPDMIFPESAPVPVPEKTDPIFHIPSEVGGAYPSGTRNMITGSGTVNTAFFPQNGDIIFDTSRGDIYIRFTRGNYAFLNKKVNVQGDNRVYFYLDDDVTISIQNDTQFGDLNAIKSGSFSDQSNWTFDSNNINHAPKITIISNSSSSKIIFDNRCLLSAYIYMPFSSIESSAGYFCGSFYVATIVSRANTRFAYIPPDATSPLPGGGGGGGGVTVLGNYSGKSKLPGP